MGAPLRTDVDEALRETGQRLLAAAIEAAAYGLAAAHIGETAPVVVVGGEGEPREYRLLYNPRVVVAAEETAAGEEGSVSLPGARVSIDRPVWADIAWMDETGAAYAERFTGFLARVAIHEIEQMQGIFFLDRLSRLKREMALKKARKHAG
jgi:peptide deformylase